MMKSLKDVVYTNETDCKENTTGRSLHCRIVNSISLAQYFHGCSAANAHKT